MTKLWIDWVTLSDQDDLLTRVKGLKSSVRELQGGMERTNRCIIIHMITYFIIQKP